jgi:regulator of protease activity HflC (stomatin/prohibitin superfamily)
MTHPSRTNEISRRSSNGYLMVAIGLLLIALGLQVILMAPVYPAKVLVGLVPLVAGALVLAGLYMLQPNEAAILLLFGKYVGTDR